MSDSVLDSQLASMDLGEEDSPPPPPRAPIPTPAPPPPPPPPQPNPVQAAAAPPAVASTAPPPQPHQQQQQRPTNGRQGSCPRRRRLLRPRHPRPPTQRSSYHGHPRRPTRRGRYHGHPRPQRYPTHPCTNLSGHPIESRNHLCSLLFFTTVYLQGSHIVLPYRIVLIQWGGQPAV